jgi:hypothetical protein
MGSAVRVILLPNALPICAPHSRKKFGWRHSPPDGHQRMIPLPLPAHYSDTGRFYRGRAEHAACSTGRGCGKAAAVMALMPVAAF